MLGIKRYSTSRSDLKWDPRIREGGDILPLPQSYAIAEDRTITHMQRSEVNSTKYIAFLSFPGNGP